MGRIREFFSGKATSRRRGHPVSEGGPHHAVSAPEALEPRCMLSGSGPYGTHPFEMITRFANGAWVATGISDSTVDNTVVALWNSKTAWHLDQLGDFDGDGFDDIAARDSKTGKWFTAISNETTSNTSLAAVWSTKTKWSDVKALDWNGDTLDDIVGRSSKGEWNVLISNGDGTFTNRVVGSWAASAGWIDTQWLDFDADGDTDILSRSKRGSWQVGLNIAGLQLENRTVGAWSKGTWKNVGLVDLEYDFRPEIVGRNSRGEWWASKIQDESLTSRHIGTWDESQGWQDVVFSDASAYYGGGSEMILGRNAAGEWWASAYKGWSLDDNAGLDHHRFGSWNPQGGWRDVRVADTNADGTNEVVGRNSQGEWWSIDVPWSMGAPPATARLFRFVGDHKNIRSVAFGTVTWAPVSVWANRLSIRAGKQGASVSVTDSGGRIGVQYVSAGVTRSWVFAAGSVDSIDFQGSPGDDTFLNDTRIRSFAQGLRGNDTFRGGADWDSFHGDEGDDTFYVSADDFTDGGQGIDRIDIGFGLVADDSLYRPYEIATRGAGDASPTSYNDISQGEFGNCYFWAALGAVAHAGFDLTANVRHRGGTTFEVKLFVNNAWTWVSTTFDWATGSYNDRTGDPILPYDRALPHSSEKEFWPLLFWRAWNKITNEGELGFASSVTPYLTGINNSRTGINPPRIDIVQQSLRRNWITSAMDNGHAVTTSTGEFAASTFKKGSLDPLGRVLANHAYAVIAASENGLTLYNPWGVDGNWEVFDTNRNKYLDPEEENTYNSVAVDGEDDGVFSLSWAEWFRYFTDFAINPC